MEDEHTTPPCLACSSHDELERTIKRSEKTKATQHNEILIKLDRTIGDMRWMKIIGNWVLVTMLGYFIAIGIFLFTNDYATNDDVTEIKKNLDKGEILHYQNENDIAGMKSKIDFIVKHVKDI